MSAHLLEAKYWLYTLGVNLFSKCSFCSALASKVVGTICLWIYQEEVLWAGRNTCLPRAAKGENAKWWPVLITLEPVLTAMYKGKYYWNFRDGTFFLLLTALIKPSSHSLKTEVLYSQLRALSISFILPTASSGPGMVWARPWRGRLPYLHYSVGILSTSPAMWGELQGSFSWSFWFIWYYLTFIILLKILPGNNNKTNF